jgi:hypothetical protein
LVWSKAADTLDRTAELCNKEMTMSDNYNYHGKFESKMRGEDEFAADFRHCDHDTPLNDDGECLTCKVEHEREKTYRFRVFAAEPEPITVDEIRDAYSHPTDAHKRAAMLRERGEL